MVCVSVPDPSLQSTLFVAEFREDIRAAIPGFVECLKDPNDRVRFAAIEGLSKLGAHGLCQRP
jgi:HEAT repeat protein